VLDPTGADKQNCFDTATFQYKLVAAETMDRSNPDPVKRLPVHAWVDLTGLTAASLARPRWADATTGRSSVVWDRALGWYVMGLVDVLEYLPAYHADYSALVGILNDIVPGLKATQDPSTGLWYQVVDQGSLTDNWLETSGSAMFIYALKKAVRAGYISSQYDAVANLGWQGLKSRVIIL
jgi:unsaturated rhamnogalacturonyl hydrolase